MQAGEYDRTGMELPAVTRTVFIDGQRVDDTWLLGTTIEAEIASDLPEIVAGVGSTGQPRYGTVTIGPRSDVDEGAPSPLNREGIWPPQRGQSIVIEDATSDQRWRRATGVVVDVNAPIGEQNVTLSWRDGMDDLISEVELAPIASGMPGEEVIVNGEARRYMTRTGIEPWGIVVSALHDAGYRLLPSESSVDFMCLVQGNLHPRIGRVAAANKSGNVLEWDDESGFQYISEWTDFTPGYTERESGEEPVIYLRKTVGGPTAQTRWTMADGAEVRVTLVNNSVAVSRIVGGVSTVLIQQGFITTSPLPWVGVLLGVGGVKIWTADDKERYVSYDSLGMGHIAVDWSRVRIHGAAAVQVAYRRIVGWPGFNWPSLRFRGGGPGLVRETVCTRSIENETAGKVIGDISAATLTGFWMDEFGTLNWVPSVRLEGASPVDSINEVDDVISGSWSEIPDGVARAVTVNYDEVALTTASTVRVTVKEGSGGQTISGGDVIEEFVGPDGNEEWIEPDMTPLPASQNAITSMRRGLLSMWGGCYVEEAGTTEDNTNYGWAQMPYGRDYLRIGVENLTPRRWKVTHTAVAGAPEIQLVILPGAGTSVPVSWRGKPLPLWRARGRALFTGNSVQYRQGPSWAREYSHDLGAWGSRNDAHRIGDWLSKRMSTPMLYLDQVQQIPDPRRQLGDVVEMNMTKTMGGVLRLLTVGIRESTSPGEWRQTIDYRVISAVPSDIKTYGQIEDTYNTYAAAEDAKSTYAEIEG